MLTAEVLLWIVSPAVLAVFLLTGLLVSCHRQRAALVQAAERCGRLERLIGVGPDPIVIFDRNGNQLEAFQCTSAERELFEHLGRNEPQRLQSGITRAMEQRRAIHLEVQLRARHFAIDLLPLEHWDEGGAVAARVTDETELRRSHSRLRSLATRGDAILQSAMDGFFVVGEDYRFIEVNDSFCRMLGYTREALMEMRISELEIEQPPRGLGAPPHARTGLHHFPTAHRHRGGHVVYLEISVNVLRDEGRKILVGFARDVTERYRTEREMQRLVRQNELILNSVGEGICGVSVDGRVTFVNPAALRMLRCSATDLLGEDLHRILSEQGACDPDACPLCSVLRGARHRCEVEHTSLRHDGTRFPAEVTTAPIWENGEIVGATVVVNDMTERRQAEDERARLQAEVQQAQKLESLGMLAGGIAHDFNNFLVGVLGNASLALERTADDHPAHANLRKIVRAAERASQITHQMLAYSGNATYEVRPLDLNRLVRDTADFMRAALPKNVELNLHLDDTIGSARADNGQIQQVLVNLLINGVEAIGDQPGAVEMSTTLTDVDDIRDATGHELPAGQYVQLEVRDNGCGMTPETRARIFEPFFTRKSTGRGLGLAAMLGILRAHDAGIFVETAPGAGSTFTVLLPAAGEAETPPAKPPRASLPGRCTILIVDDEEEIRDVVHSILESRGVNVLVAENGQRAVELFEKRHAEIDAVLLDMTMPGMSGSDVFKELVRIAPDVRVIISSGYSEKEITGRLGTSPVSFVHKPYTVDALVGTIRDALAPSSVR